MPEAMASSSNGKLSGDAIAKLTEKLTELMGPEAVQEFNQNRNERGELVNEEGLPVIDISEPIDGSMRSIPPPITVEPLIPLAVLPPSAQARFREKRNRILDLLEEEERQANLLEQQHESQERVEILRKRKEDAAREKDKIKQAREMQKKMGRALLQNIGKTKEKEDQEKEAQRLRDEEADKRRSPSTKKKTVAFVDETPLEGEVKAESPQSMDWGDIIPARLQSTKRPTLMSQALLDRHPMKMSVVERVPGGHPTLPKSPRPFQQVRDSDDESDPDNDSDESDTDVSMDNEEPFLNQDDVDMDFARHQREIALEYYNKRGTIGQEAATTMNNHSHALDEELDLGPEVTREPAKPAISQFRASRLASAYSASAPTSLESASISLGASVLPASSIPTVQRAIRTGKLDADGRLIGAEADSASEEEDEGMQEVLDLLRKGEVYNLGPDGKYLHAIPSKPPQASTSASSSSQMEESNSSDLLLPPPSMRSKTSRFKVSRAAPGKQSTSNEISIPNLSISDTLSPSVTPVSHVGRSSPKLSTPTLASVVTEKAPFAIHSPSPSKSPVQGPSPFSMIVDSPSFPMPQSSATAGPRHSGVPNPAMTTVSPSFPPAQSSRRPDRPPFVMAADVRESKGVASSPSTLREGNTLEDIPEKKVSRFKAARMES
ncbi:hypothetical protein GALMADRAFT_212454 [Galerina marginata CBS 339.88]|uniref:DUF3835 domain-containing protein n=1 Tax=Galerina marginata (strain CBS 339.88) TaxID=685588 RepID=A0A067SRU9_GALM3|nr:hypothetical protein GALMADRAFT_212454 [Galerina marginata CBS 339.88]